MTPFLGCLNLCLFAMRKSSEMENTGYEKKEILPEAIASQVEEPEGRVVLKKDEVDLCNSVGLQQQIRGLAVLNRYWRLGEILPSTVEDV